MWINFPWGEIWDRGGKHSPSSSAPPADVIGPSGSASHDELAAPDCAPTQAAPERSGGTYSWTPPPRQTPAERLAALNAEIDRKLREVNALNEQARKLSREVYGPLMPERRR